MTINLLYRDYKQDIDPASQLYPNVANNRAHTRTIPASGIREGGGGGRRRGILKRYFY